MRRKLIETDLIECVLGLGPGLFYNSPMEACVIVCRSRKPKLRGRGAFCSSTQWLKSRVSEAQSYPTQPEHQACVLAAYRAFAASSRALPAVVRTAEVLKAADGNLSIARYVQEGRSHRSPAGEGCDALAAALGDAFDREVVATFGLAWTVCPRRCSRQDSHPTVDSGA